MDINSTVKIICFTITIFFIIYFYNQLVKRYVRQSMRKLWFACGVFILSSALLLFNPIVLLAPKSVIEPELIKIIFQCFWWYTLNLLANQILEQWLWNTYFLRRGIVVTRILRDLISTALFIIILAAVIHFVFYKSVWGIFTASGVMAVILGYSAQATLSDIFAGLGLNTSKQFNEGDWIKITDDNSQPCKVIDINWRFVNLSTQENNHLSIPNSVISKLKIVNLSRPDPAHGVIVTIPVQEPIPPAQFKKIMVSAALQSPKVLRTPKPEALLAEMRSNEYLYRLVYYTKEINDTVVTDQILSIIWYKCRRQQIKLTAKSLEEDFSESMTPEVLEEFLQRTDLFSSLDKENIKQLASKAICHYYGPPELILEQGQKNYSLFIIYNGTIDVYISKELIPENMVATLTSGQYFGEMSLLTGDVVSASMVVTTETILIEINHKTIKALFAQKPELMEKMSEIVVLRKQVNENVSRHKTKKKTEESKTMIARFVDKVRNFFTHSSSDDLDNQTK